MHTKIFLGILLFSNSFIIAHPSLITSVTIKKRRIDVHVTHEFKNRYLKEDFFAEYKENINLHAVDKTIVLIPFILNVIPMVWLSNRTYSIDAMDEDLYYALEKIQKVFQLFYPSSSWEGKLIPQVLIKNDWRAAEQAQEHADDVALLFSGGLDAVCSSFVHLNTPQLLITYWGGDILLNQNTMWNSVKQKCQKYAKEHGFEHTFVKSNFLSFQNHHYLNKACPDIIAWWGSTMQGLGYAGLAAPILVSKGYPTLLIASTRSVDCPFPYGTHPMIDNEISYAGIQVWHDGADLIDRIEKIACIAHVCKQRSLPFPQLRVCWGRDPHGGNCCMCEKCVRTITELLLNDINPGDVGFPIDVEQDVPKIRSYLKKFTGFNEGLAWHWDCISRRAEQWCKEHGDCNDVVKELFSSIAQIDFHQLKRTDAKQRTLQEREQFAALWQESMCRV